MTTAFLQGPPGEVGSSGPPGPVVCILSIPLLLFQAFEVKVYYSVVKIYY